MKIKILAVILLTFILFPALFAQVAITISMNQENYIQYEPVYIRIAIRNMSGHTIAFGENEALLGSLKFVIQPAQKIQSYPIPFNTGAKAEGKDVLPHLKGLLLPPGTVRSITIRVSDYYDLQPAGSYAVRAVLTHPMLQSVYRSNTCHFSIVPGNRVWGPIEIGIPPSGVVLKKTDKIPMRSFSILTYFTVKRDVYCLLIEDSQKIYSIRRIGFDFGADLRPECRFDFLNRLNILVPASPTVFAYYQINTDGLVERKQVYMTVASSEPHLRLDKKTGIVSPVGGRVARRDQDYEEISGLEFAEDMFSNDKKSFLSDDDLIDQMQDDKDKEKKPEAKKEENSSSSKNGAAKDGAAKGGAAEDNAAKNNAAGRKETEKGGSL